MAGSALDPTVGGPAKQFLIAAQSAGVDLEDPSTPDAFVTGWNARHELD